MKRIKLTEADVTWNLECQPEDVAIDGNAMASGDDEADRETELWISDQLQSGNEWAWCHVVLTGTWRGLTAESALGCCSYQSEENFKDGGYYDDMRGEILAELQGQLDHIYDAGDVVDAK